MYIATNKPYAIFVLGAGGTGSWLCSFLDKMSLHNDVIVMDGDIVEPKNVLRQNFKMRDVNANKAEVVGKFLKNSQKIQPLCSSDVSTTTLLVKLHTTS